MVCWKTTMQYNTFWNSFLDTKPYNLQMFSVYLRNNFVNDHHQIFLFFIYLFFTSADCNIWNSFSRNDRVKNKVVSKTLCSFASSLVYMLVFGENNEETKCILYINELIIFHISYTWRCLQTIQFTDQPVKVITEQGTVGTITSDQRCFTKEEEQNRC